MYKDRDQFITDEYWLHTKYYMSVKSVVDIEV